VNDRPKKVTRHHHCPPFGPVLDHTRDYPKEADDVDYTKLGTTVEKVFIFDVPA
jgi:hypothetical protein